MYRNTTNFLFMLLLLLGCFSAIAQPGTVAGKITDQATGKPLPGVSINVKEQRPPRSPITRENFPLQCLLSMPR